MFRRWSQVSVETALSDTRVVFIEGPRQSGKSTLAQQVGGDRGMPLLTMDDATLLSAARSDPEQFLAQHPPPLILDEIQRAPEIFVALKRVVDIDQRPGRYLLTGSANPMLVPRLSDSLAGRMELLPLWPLAQAEIESRPALLVDALFSDDSTPKFLKVREAEPSNTDVIDRLLIGGFPEVCTRIDASRRQSWFESYLTTTLQRDVRDLAHIDDLSAMPRLMQCLASRVAGLVNFTDIASTLAMPQTTLKRYIALLEATFLVLRIPAWFRNVGKRLVKSPKMMLVDSGLAATLLRVDRDRIERDPMALGPLLENFVTMEIVKQCAVSEFRPRPHHFRSHTGDEVDLVLEGRGGKIVGIEVKSTRALQSSDFNGLRTLADIAGDSFTRGIVLYRGDHVLPFGDRMYAVPLPLLWGTPAAA